MKKLLVLLASTLTLALLSTSADAKHRKHHRYHHRAVVSYYAHPLCNVVFPCEGVAPSPRGIHIAKRVGIGGPQLRYTPTAARHAVHLPRPRHVARPVSSYGAPYHPLARTLNGLVRPLAAKIAEIESRCRARLVSGVRHTYIAGTRRISLHASGKAADVSGDYRCIYAHLVGWPGGYSIDAHRMRHIHISYDVDGRREWGVRFAHHHGYAHHRRYARHHRHQRYAQYR